MATNRRKKSGFPWLAMLVAAVVLLLVAGYLLLRPRPAAIDSSADQPPEHPPALSATAPTAGPAESISGSPSRPPAAADATVPAPSGEPMATPDTAPIAPPASPEAPAVPAPDATHAAGAPHPPTLSPRASKQPCASLLRELEALFTYLDEQPYVKEYEFDRPIGVVLADMAARLFANPPVVLHEDRDLFTVARNTAHLYRVLGAKNIFFLRDLLREERGRIEHDLAVLLPFCLRGCRHGDFALPFEGVYEYASFFLTTIGGRSYLFRRDPDLRFLARYYSILVIDAANDRVRNKYGIALAPLIAEAKTDLQAAAGLLDRDEYAATLAQLEKKYATSP